MNKTKWGILGLGKIAGKFAKGLKEVEDAELYAVASREAEKAETFKKDHTTTKAFDSYEAMLKDEDLDVVYIATPHVFHHRQTLLCLQHKKAVLCEKPFAMNKAEVEEMIATAKKENVFLMEALWTQFLPHFKYLTKITESGEYGKIKNLKANFGFPAPFDKNKRLFNKQLGGGSLLDIGIYPIFLALSLLGKPDKISAKATIGQTSVDENCYVLFGYKNQVEAELESSIIKKLDTTAVIQFEKATVLVNTRFHEPSSIKITTPNSEELKEFEVTGNGYEFEAAHVQKMLSEGRKESTDMTFEKSLQLIELLDTVREKIKLEY